MYRLSTVTNKVVVVREVAVVQRWSRGEVAMVEGWPLVER